MARPIRSRITSVALAAGVMVAGATFAIVNAGQATAQAPVAPVPAYSLQCSAPGTNSFGLNPALTLVTQPTTVARTTAYRNCVAPAFPNIRSGYEHLDFTIPDDCNIMLNAGGTSNYNITWNTMQTSRFTGTRAAALSGTTLTVTFNGSITAGLFAGRRAQQIFKGDAHELVDCLNGVGRVPFIISDVTFTVY